MSDNEDYMSSAFLDVKEDVRPGLAFSKSTKRKHEIEKKRCESNKLHRTKSFKQLEEEHRNAGLDSALQPDNKGFAMLQKMGYKPGMKLGSQKEVPLEKGITEPIKIKIKAGRGGLGREEEIRRKIVEREERRGQMKVYREKETERLTAHFRERMKSKMLYQQLLGDLRKCQKACEGLDSENNVEEPMRPWFWYSHAPDESEEEWDEDDEEEEEKEEEGIKTEEQVFFIISYLRSKYCYCLWCGIKYDSHDDMASNCPGVEKADHDD